jgi:hypothetical protein
MSERQNALPWRQQVAKSSRLRASSLLNISPAVGVDKWKSGEFAAGHAAPVGEECAGPAEPTEGIA